ncbi:dihydrolipoamide acetyltransferase family protein [Gaiella sp.]|uniref:dihydrolipoamide acetyltransferase family protein n=1 Tax=Gaiella sp. TaxID=2663207 RepID=UPI003264CFCE
MATEVKLPRLGQGMESGTIVRWLKAEGDAVKANEPLYELDTDKVTQEVESEVAGVLLKIVVPEGETEVGTTIALIGNDSNDVTVQAASSVGGGAEAAPSEAPAAAEPEPDVPTSAGNGSAPESVAATPEPVAAAPEPVAAAPESVTATPESVTATPGARIKASPLARRIARERGLELSAIAGTGPDGRILAEDVERAPAGGSAQPAAPASILPASGEIEVIQLSTIRKTIARRLTEAWAAPVFQLGVSIDMSETLHLREQLVARLAEGDTKPTVNDLLTKFVGVALLQHRALNATFIGDEINRHPSAHVGMAVAAPNGLVVPVIRDADRRSVQEIARARADLVGRARDGKLTLPDMEGGTFTISNLGMFGIEQFVAVLNPPQVAILAVGAVKDTPVVVDGEIDIAPMMQVVLTCDHRAIDGADGARFLRTLVALVEQPALAL